MRNLEQNANPRVGENLRTKFKTERQTKVKNHRQNLGQNQRQNLRHIVQNLSAMRSENQRKDLEQNIGTVHN